MKRKLLSAALAGATALFMLTACGSAGNEAESQQQTQEAENAVEQTTVQEEVQKEEPAEETPELSDEERAQEVADLIDAIYVQERTDETDALCEQAKRGELEPADVSETMVSDLLYTAGQPDPDLIVRPSGELRLSNFLVWQSAYAEFFFDDVLWPDFTPADLDRAIAAYNQRDRRFGDAR